jgi:hypothetical protein
VTRLSWSSNFNITHDNSTFVKTMNFAITSSAPASFCRIETYILLNIFVSFERKQQT